MTYNEAVSARRICLWTWWLNLPKYDTKLFPQVLPFLV